MPKPEGEMSAFERRRLENMAANKAILSDISTTAQKLIPAKRSAPASTTPRRRTRAETTKRDPPLRTRMSSRLAGLDADGDSPQKRALAIEIEQAKNQHAAKRARNGNDMNLSDIVMDGKKYGASIDALKGLFRGAQPGLRTFTKTEIDETTDKAVKDIQLRMSSLKLYEHWLPNEIKITPGRIYALGFHPTQDKPVVFAGDKEGAIGVFDGSQTKPEHDDDDTTRHDPVISAFKIHARTITSFVFSPADSNSVFTSSYDSSIRRMDIEKGVSVQVFAPSDDREDLPLSALDMAPSEPHTLYYSTLDGGVGRIDLRDPSSTELWMLSEQKIGGFSLHPLHPHLIATASLDRTLKIWDTRRMTGKDAVRHPVLLGEHESRLSVSHASWSAGGHIATSSYDDTIKIYDFSSAKSWKPGHDIPPRAMAPTHSIRHNNQTGRWVTILKPQWQKQPLDGVHKLAIGNMNRFVDVFSSDGIQLAQLDGEGITAVPAVAHFHPSLDWVAGGNGSGKLCLWM